MHRYPAGRTTVLFTPLATRLSPRLGQRGTSRFYIDMLTTDVGNGYIPSGMGRGRQQSALAHCKYDSPVDLGRVFRRALRGTAHRGGLADAVFEFIRETAVTMMASGEAVYEIVYPGQVDREDDFHFEFARVTPGTYEIKRNCLRQEIPADMQRTWNLPKNVTVPLANIVRFVFPKQFETDYRVLVQSLDVSSASMPDFAFSEMRQMTSQSRFEFSVFKAQNELTLAAATSSVGWTARTILGPRMLEYYYVYRMLRFVEFRLWLRDLILVTLNEALSRAGAEVGLSGSIVLNGVRTVDEVRSTIYKMSRREVDLKQALNYYD